MLTREQIMQLGLAEVGEHVQISELARFYGASRIRIGNHVRIDDFCILSAGEGGIAIGNYVHIAPFCALIGQDAIVLSDFAGLSSRVTIYSSTDDYSGMALTNPTVPDELRNVRRGPVFLGRHVIVGSGAVILPGVTLEDGVAVGALSLVQKNCAAFGVYFGAPARRISERSRKLLELEARVGSYSQAPRERE